MPILTDHYNKNKDFYQGASLNEIAQYVFSNSKKPDGQTFDQWAEATGVNKELKTEQPSEPVRRNLGAIPQEDPQRTVSGTLKDIAITGAKSVIGTGEALVGLADIPTFGRVGKGMEKYLGYDPKLVHETLSEYYSPAQKAAFENVENAKGFIPTVKEMIKNPSTIGHAVLESAPQMLGGAAAAKKLLSSGLLKMTPTWNKIIASAMGEGLISAGASAEGIRQQTEDGLLTPKQAAISVASGIGTGLFSVVGGRVAEKFGFIDPDTFLSSGSKVTKTGVLKRIIGGGISEGAFEELPQSMQEQVWLNAALDKPLLEGVSEAGATGLLTGMAMGAGFNVFAGDSDTKSNEIDNQINKQAENIISNGTEVVNEAITQIDKNLNDFNALLNDSELLESKAIELDKPVEELTVDLNDQINMSTQLMERLMAGTTSAETIPTEDEPTEDVLTENTKLEHDLKNESSTFTNEQQVESLTNQSIENQLVKKDINLNPSEAQKEAGNYKKAPIKIDSFDIVIENPHGSTRSGKDKDGNEWASEIVGHYGYFKRTEGKDGDQVDVFIAPNTVSSPNIYVIDQVNSETGKFDEHKIIMGVNSKEEAKKLYLNNYEKNWQGFGAITEMDHNSFKEWLNDSKKTKKAFALGKETNIKNNVAEISEDETSFDLRQNQTPGQGVQVKDIQKIFPGQNVLIEKDGKISVHLKNNKGIIFENIKNAGNNFIEFAVQTGQMSKEGKILGITIDNKILLDSEFADNKTLWHENKHVLDNLGMITKEDDSALNKEFNKLRKTDKLQFELSTHEDPVQRMKENRANMFAQIMISREEYSNTPFDKMIQKIIDFFDQLYLMGHRVVTGNQEFQTTSGLARETESGKLYERTVDDSLTEKNILPQFTYVGAQANIDNKSILNKAIEMEQSGKDNEDIRKETGWFLGMDDKWRFEIDDRKAELDIGKLINQSNLEQALNLKDVFNHPTLYKAYPELENIKFGFKKLPEKVNATYNYKTKKIELNSNNLKKDNIQSIAKKVILHEVQHAIQGIEGFATGGKPTLKNTAIGNDLSRKLNYFEKINLKKPEQRTEKENIAYNWLEKNVPKLKILARKKAYSQYRKLAGEIESRDVSERMNWTPEEREITAPYETQGIPKEEAVIQFNTAKAAFEVRESLPKQKISDEQYTKIYQEKENILKKIQQSAGMKLSEIKLIADKSLTPISTRLKNINLEELSEKLRWLDIKTAKQITETLKEAHPMMKKAKKMSSIDRLAWDSARKNSDIEKITQLVEKYDIKEHYNNIRETLDQIRQDAIDVGLDIGFVEDYWPRILKDRKGFLQATQEISREPEFTKAIQKKANTLGITVAELTQKYPDLRADIISNIILGRASGIGGSSNVQGRVFETIPDEYVKFYMNSDAALMQYIYSMTKQIEARRFFGKVPQRITKIKQRRTLAQTESIKLENLRDLAYSDGLVNEDQQKLIDSHNKRIDLLQENIKDYDAEIAKYKNQRDYTENIGVYIDDLMLSGKLHKKDEQTVRDILDARFHERGTTGVVSMYKNISYIDVMGNPMAAVTQIGDLGWGMFVGEIWNPLRMPSNIKNLIKAAFKKSNITKEDLSITRMAQEFADFDSLSSLVSKVFKYTGLERIDSIGKEFLINNAFDAYKRQASSKEGRIKLLKKIRPMFGNQSNKVINELLALSEESTANPSENIKVLLYSRLLDFQPVGLSEMPENYLKGGNWRILYMLKTFTLKQFDVFRNEVWRDLKTGDAQQKLQAIKRMVQLMGVLAFANAGADEIKDFMVGKETKFKDIIIENFLTMGGANRFVRMQARREGLGTATGQLILPPFKFVNSLSKDVFNADGIKDFMVGGDIFDYEKSRTLESLPLIGKLAYWHVGRGSEYRPSIEEQDFKKIGKKFRKFKKTFEETNDKRLFLRTNADDFKQLKIYENFSRSIRKITTLINKLEKLEQTTNIRKRVGQLTENQNQIRQRYFNLIENME